jgi:hypothetical protein
MSNDVQVVNNNSMVTAGFQSAAGFALLQRMANMFSGSSLVPKQFQGQENFGNCVIALNMAQRLNADPLMVMQNLYVVYGNPSWSSKFLIAMFNQCGRYESIHYDETGKKGTDTQGVAAWAKEKSTGEIIKGPEVTIKIAKDEGWYAKNGSKWKSMPDQMLRYRAAAWFIRTTAPELSMGLQTTDEIIDVTPESSSRIEKPLDEIHQYANSEEIIPQSEPAQVGPAKEAQLPIKQEIPKESVKEPAAKSVKPKAELLQQESLDGPGF